jgi:DNA repair protein RecO (recombination protein O)
VLFISEVLSKSILEEEKNSALFNYIKSSVLWLDSSKKYVNFHIQFLIKILKYLGISPNFEENLDFFENSKNKFDYSDDFNDKISRKFIEKFEFLLGTNFDNGFKCMISNEERKEFLEFLMSYMSIHIGGFRRPNSLNIMYELFKKE